MYGGAQVGGHGAASNQLLAAWMAANDASSGAGDPAPAATPGPRSATGEDPLRLALLDRDTGFVVVLTKRMEALAWEHHAFAPSTLPKRLIEMRFDAVIVDIELLGDNAWRWLKTVSRAEQPPAIVVCTARSTVEDRVRALELGVDDWLNKPCHPEELMARVEAVVRQRRRLRSSHGGSFLVGEVEIKPGVYQAFVGKQSLQLTSREYRILALLASRLGTVCERGEMYEYAWGKTMAREDRSVDVVIHKLRRKLLDASPLWQYIHTHPGVGYRLAPSCCEPADRRRPQAEHPDEH